MDYSHKTLFILLTIVVDIIVHAIANHTSDATGAYLMLGILVIMRIVMLVATFILIWDTVLFRFGLLGILCKRLSPFVITFPISTLITIAYAGARAAILGSGKRRDELWNDKGIQAVLFIDYVFCILCYAMLFHYMLELAKPEYYKTTEWIGSKRR
mmetsp:Transcript_17083/g.30610  ORF Transcript_17083/g.30610 Transcript_17083/m.30610 type:complete len:156 (-) Transcript_17083:175-642(-)